MTARQEQLVRDLAHFDRQRNRRVEQLVSLNPGERDMMVWICDDLDRLHLDTMKALREFSEIENGR